MQTVEKQVYSVNEVSKLLSISRNLAYRLCRQKQIPGVIFLGPKRIVVSALALDKLLFSSSNADEAKS